MSSDSEGWKRWAVGSDTVLCLNFFLVILPVLRSIFDSLHSHTWLSKVSTYVHMYIHCHTNFLIADTYSLNFSNTTLNIGYLY